MNILTLPLSTLSNINKGLGLQGTEFKNITMLVFNALLFLDNRHSQIIISLSIWTKGRPQSSKVFNSGENDHHELTFPRHLILKCDFFNSLDFKIWSLPPVFQTPPSQTS